jgi:hypothetical protein
METVYCQKIGKAKNAYTIFAMSDNGNFNIIFQGNKKAILNVSKKYGYKIEYVK